MTRLRLGILLFIISWLPIAQLLLYIAHNHQQLTSQQATNDFRLAVWIVQVIIGLVGVWLAGKIAMAEARKDGWRRTPRHLWDLLRHGQR